MGTGRQAEDLAGDPALLPPGRWGWSTPLLVALQAPALHEGWSEDSGCVWSTRVRAAAAAGGWRCSFADWGSPGNGTRHVLASQRVNPLTIEATFGWHVLQVVAQATEVKIPTEVRAPGRGVKGSCGSKMGDWSRRALHTPGGTGPASQMLGGP